jgi:25S rRNA (uracil2634-N3)-methyltransferase
MSFLRSASNFLTLGPVPSFTPVRKRKSDEDDDDDDDETADGVAEGSHQIDGTESAKKRGTILITLRNVEPYTLWLVNTS